jgi:TonB family protein
MELLDGDTLTELLNEHRFRPLPDTQARSIIEGLCRGLTYAHELGIIHADVKPGNVFVTHDGNTKLLDFGISLATNDQSQKSDVYAHTPSYASCEVLEGAEPTAQDDVYSLACVAYRILAGRRAYDGATAHAAETEKLELKPIEHLSPNEWKALCHAMAFRRADRTADVRSFLNEFSTKSAVTPLPDAPEPEETEQISPFMLIPRAARLGAALLVIIAATTALWPDRQEEQDVAQVSSVAAPELTNNTEPVDIGPPLALRNRQVAEPEVVKPAVAEAEKSVVAASPAQPKPKKKLKAPDRPKPAENPMRELSKKADASLDQRLLLQPAENSAKLYLEKMQAIDPNAIEFIQARQRFADLMMLEVMVAIADEDFAAAEILVSETKSLGVDSETTERYETALSKAKETKSAREADSLGSIFASAMPAAILANPDFEQNPSPGPLSDPVIGLDTINDLSLQQAAHPGVPDDRPGEPADIPDEQSIDSTPDTLPLSAFKFKRRVQPKYPRHAADRKLSGWVELRFLVNAKGKTESIQVTDSQPPGSFEEAATKAISKWRFKPIIVDGMPAEKYSAVRLRFEP